ncbi:MAG TPA: hypothetical protein VMW41_01115 [Candidatus Bathyarchaeia archaeon]|nr:hypothetical protein [Candidatus Bathyarchaeia archaeon]
MKSAKFKAILSQKENYLYLSFIIFLLLRLPSLFEPLVYGDEGVYLTLGQALRKGLVFYRDIHDNKPPLLYLIAAIAGNFKTYRLLYFLWTGVGFFFFHNLAQKLFPKEKRSVRISILAFSILAPIPLFEGTIANAENFLIYTSIAGFLILLRKKNLKSGFFFAGCLFSLSTLFKVPAVFDFVTAIIVFFVLQKESFRKIIISFTKPEFWSLVFGFLAPIASSIIYYSLKGAGSDYFNAAFAQNIPYLSSWTPSVIKTSPLPFSLPLRALLVLSVVISLFVLRRKKPSSTTFNLIIGWFFLNIFAALLSSRPYPHYLYQALPAFCLSLGLLFSSYRALKLIPIIFVLILSLIFTHFDYYRYPVWPYYQNFYQYLIGIKSHEEYSTFWSNQILSLYQTANFIKTHSAPNEKIFVWGDQTCLYPLAERLPVGRYAAAYHIKDFDKDFIKTLAALSLKPPRLFVVFKNEKESLGKLFYFLHQNYSLIETFGEIEIYHRDSQR